MARKTTMADVARAAGVSPATVDRVLNARGGVAARKEEAVLASARALGLDRALALRPSRTLRIGVLIQRPHNPFHAALKEGLDLGARLHADLNMQFLVQHIDPREPKAIARLIRAQAPSRDGLIVTCPDEPGIAEALREASARIPVVTLATEVRDCGRRAYVGPDDRRAGRVAGDLMGRFLGAEGGRILMIAGLLGMSSHRDRERGLREALAQFHPGAVLSQVVESGEDAETAGRLALQAFREDRGLRGIYHTTNGALPVVQALRSLGLAEKVVFVTHELTPDRRALLRERALDAVIDQNPRLESRIAIETMAQLLGRLPEVSAPGDEAIRIFLAENT